MNNTEISEIYKTPNSDLTIKDNNDNRLFSVSPTKLVIMYAVTMGVYSLVFFYQHWKAQKRSHTLKVNPVLRAVFSIFFVHSLFGKIKDEAEEKDITDLPAFSGLATLFIICSLLSWLISNIPGEGVALIIGYPMSIILTLVALIPLYKAQLVANLVNDDKDGSLNAHFTWINWVFIVLGTLIWLTSLLGVYLAAVAPV